MSLVNVYRIKNEEIRRLKKENKILKNEIIMLKKLLFSLELSKK